MKSVLCKIWGFHYGDYEECRLHMDVAPCRSCGNRCFGGTYRLHLQSSHLPTLIPRSRIFLPWMCRRYFPPKRRVTQDLHGATSQKTAFFINQFWLNGPYMQLFWGKMQACYPDRSCSCNPIQNRILKSCSFLTYPFNSLFMIVLLFVHSYPIQLIRIYLINGNLRISLEHTVLRVSCATIYAIFSPRHSFRSPEDFAAQFLCSSSLVEILEM
jgi:hypothetical protein